jgi:hypothetical protein
MAAEGVLAALIGQHYMAKFAKRWQISPRQGPQSDF